MSFPMTFELKSDTEFDFNQVTTLLKASAAAQEESLSRLTDVERKKVTYILERCKKDINNGSMAEALEQSIDEILRTIGKLQVVLQLRTEHTEPLYELPTPPAPSDSPDFPAISAPSESPAPPILPVSNKDAQLAAAQFDALQWPIMAGQNEPPRMSIPTPIASAGRPCAAVRQPITNQPSLAGFAKGSITNPQDEFFNQTAVLRAYIPCTDVESRSIRYTVNAADSGIHFYATGRHITTQNDIGRRAKAARSDTCKNGLVVSGQGFVRIRRPNLPECVGKAVFTLAVQNAKNGLEFRIQITAPDSCPSHDSGMVITKPSQSDMCLRVC